MKKPVFLVPMLVSLVLGLHTALPSRATPTAAIYYVAPHGVYANPGTEAAPTTLAGARDKIRALGALPTGGVTVYLRGGVYKLSDSLALTAQDSGTENAPILYRAYEGETPILSGGTSLDPAWFSRVTNSSPVWGRLDPAARDKLWQVNLPAHGISDFGTLTRRGFSVYSGVSALELAFNDQMMELARWPSRGHSDPFDEDAPAIVTGTLVPNVAGTYEYIGTAAGGNANDGYPNYRRVGLVNGEQYYLYHCTWTYNESVHTYWFISPYDPVSAPNCWPTAKPSWWGYGDEPQTIPVMKPLANSSGNAQIRTQPEDYAAHGFVRIPQVFSNTSFRLPGTRYQRWNQAASLWFQGLFYHYWADDTLSGTVNISGVVTLAGQPTYGIQDNQPFAVLNLLEEIDAPGEWYLDRSTGILYFWPPAELMGSKIAVSLLEVPLLTLNGTRFVDFEGMTFELSRRQLVTAQNVDRVRFRNCIFRNNGGNAVDIQGSNSGLEYAQVYGAGGAAVILSGGSRPTLTPSNNFVRNSHIHHFGRWDRTYHNGVRLRGCGSIVEHNKISDAPHAAILFTGNEHRIRYNDIGYVVQESNDAGAIYTGRDWGYRGNDISFNFIHHIESVFGGSNGVYLDDAASGIRVFGNVLYRIRGAATLNGGGRDNLVENNIIVRAHWAHYTDRRAQAFATYDFDASGCPSDWNLLGRINIVYEGCWAGNKQHIDYQRGVWAEHYPALAVIPNDWGQVNDTHWLEPEGSTFTCNNAWQVKTLILQSTYGGENPLAWYAKWDNNLVADPLFVDEANLNLALRPDSPVYSQLACFQRIPFEQIGIQEKPDLVLYGAPGNKLIALTWQVNTTLPPTSTWRVAYYTRTASIYTATDPYSTTRSLVLTQNVQNYQWYTVTLNAMLGSTPFLTDTVRVMPTDRFVYLPVVVKGNQ